MGQADEPSDPCRSLLLYAQTSCADSARIRMWLAQHGVAFVERNVTGNPAVAHELPATGGFATPLLFVWGRQGAGLPTAGTRRRHRDRRNARGTAVSLSSGPSGLASVKCRQVCWTSLSRCLTGYLVAGLARWGWAASRGSGR